MKKSWLAIIIGLMLVLSGCVETKSGTGKGEDKEKEKKVESAKKVELEILGMSTQEDDLNIVRDQLTKNGYDVKLNIQPDYGSYKAQEDAGNYDLSMSGWTTVTGNPDYAVRSLYSTGGDYSKIADSELDALINQASTETPEEYVNTYKEFEEKLVFENAYIAPLYTNFKTQAINSAVLDADTVRLSKSRSLAWESINFNDTSKSDVDPLVLSQTESSLTSLDPVKGNDGSINMLNTNMYVRLVNLTDDDVVISDGSLSYNHSIAEGNEEYYFLLRDDINFAKIENGAAVDTGELVSAQDVIFSLNRMKDKDSVPDHRTYTLHEHIDSAEIVTDLSALDDTTTSDGSSTVREALEKGLDQSIDALVTDTKEVDNATGAYQVVKLTTTEPFPQVLNYLAHQSAGIVSEKQVSAINTYDVATYDVNKDISYGDQSTITKGSRYDNQLYASGPYILVEKDDYVANFVKNPAYMPGTEHEAKISKVDMRFIKDTDNALAALRNSETHILYGLPQTKLDIVDSDEKLTNQSMISNAVVYLHFNVNDREVGKSEDLRKSILYAINQEEFIDYYHGKVDPAVSTLSPLVDTGNQLVADPEKVEEFYKKYEESK